MMKNLSRAGSSQKGSISLILTLFVAIIGALSILNMSGKADRISQQHSRERTLEEFQSPVRQIAQEIKQSFHMAQMSSTCPLEGGRVIFRRINVNGIHFCVPISGAYCIGGSRDTENRFCASASVRSLNWSQTSSGTSAGSAEGSGSGGSSRTGSRRGRSNRITIPSSASNLWRSCQAPSVCVRIVLCKAGVSSCNSSSAARTQVVRIGSL